MRLDTAPMKLGRVGVWVSAVIRTEAAETRRVAAGVEELGFQALWFPESTGKEVFSAAASMLEATSRIVIASGIANVWARDPLATVAGASTLADAFPNRFLLGLGISHAPLAAARGHDYQRPLRTMSSYLDAMEHAPYTGPPADSPVVLAALGPRMLQLAGARTAGAHPYFVPVDHTRLARRILGPTPVLAPEQAVVLEADPGRARQIARTYTSRYLSFDNYRRNLERLGWGASDLADAGSDRLVDAVVAWGNEARLAERIAEHLEAGADHVAVQVITTDRDASPLPVLERLAPLLMTE